MRKIITLTISLLLVLTMAVPAFAAETTLPTNTAIEETAAKVTSIKSVVPTGVKAATYSYNKIKVSWDRIDGVDGYKVYRASSKNGKYELAYTTENPDKTYYINSGRTCGKTYYYKVHGFKKVNGKNTYTKYSAVTSTYARPNKVKNVKTEILYETKGHPEIDKTSTSTRYYWSIEPKYDSTDITLTWDKVPGATGYAVYVRKIGDKWKRIGSTIKTKYAYDFDYEYEYEFKVKAYRTVNGSKVYGYYSNTTPYQYDWDWDKMKNFVRETAIGAGAGEVVFVDCDGRPENASFTGLWGAVQNQYIGWNRTLYYGPGLANKIESEVKYRHADGGGTITVFLRNEYNKDGDLMPNLKMMYVTTTDDIYTDGQYVDFEK